MTDVVIVGAGIVGATLACGLCEAGLRVTLIEAKPKAAGFKNSRAYALTLLTAEIFQNLGVWATIEPQITAFRQIRLSDGDDPGVVFFRPEDLQRSVLGYVGEHGVLLKALYDRLAQFPHLTWLCPATVLAVTYGDEFAQVQVQWQGNPKEFSGKANFPTPDWDTGCQSYPATDLTPDVFPDSRADLTPDLTPGSTANSMPDLTADLTADLPSDARADATHSFTLQTQLVVAADGARSPLRQAAGIGTQGWKYWQSCLGFTVKTEKSHEQIAYERFWPSGPFAILPLPGNRAQVVWTAPHAEAQHLANLPEAAFLAALSPRYGSQMGHLTLETTPQVFPVQLMQSDRYVQFRLALVGDAAHCCHPVGGQGMNLGIRDAAALTEILGKAHHQGKDLGSLDVLRPYERWRKAENLTILGFTDLLDRLFSNQWLPWVFLRRLGLALLRHVYPVRVLALKLMTGQLGRKPLLKIQCRNVSSFGLGDAGYGRGNLPG